jgi:hypothetical protein
MQGENATFSSSGFVREEPYSPPVAPWLPPSTPYLTHQRLTPNRMPMRTGKCKEVNDHDFCTLGGI